MKREGVSRQCMAIIEPKGSFNVVQFHHSRSVMDGIRAASF